ncbi:MAG: hypothetical protein A2W26_12075 [Acidobacteria bacterium RBG_16_64_8]|nr:MAG: hypothetical protein A2W26_12075 [Acidobacteria bacterium RBG_16_64_8]
MVQYQYDGNGNVSQTTAFATLRATNLATDLASLTSWASTNGGNAQNQVTRYWYDGADRARFVLDPEGHLRETRYNDGGREARKIIYAAKPSIAANATLANVVSAAATIANAANDRLTVTLADMAARVTRVTDAEGYRTDYVYDAVGNRIETHVALNVGATQWAITRRYYDNANREAYTLSAEGYLTRNDYDGVGQLTAQTVYDQIVAIPPAGSNPTPIAADTGHVRRFVYDAAGRRTRETTELLTYTRGVTSYVIPANATWAARTWPRNCRPHLAIPR